MPTFGLFPDSALALGTLGALLGLLVGSFLNVVVHRLPRMLERQWADDCATAFPARSEGDGAQATAPAAAAYNLWRPRSSCPHCGHRIAWHENIPVLSWLLLRGKCSACAGAISARYPLTELATALLFAFVAWRWGVTFTAAAWAMFAAALLALALIDWDTTFLPDDINLPLLWAGLIAAALGWTGVALADALWGAVAGYLSLWSVYQAFRLATGKDGMGFGDFKLFAALGAWFGWQALIPMILLASATGAAVGIALKLRGGLRKGGYVPFGPFLALAGLTAMIAGPQRLLQPLGL